MNQANNDTAWGCWEQADKHQKKPADMRSFRKRDSPIGTFSSVCARGGCPAADICSVRAGCQLRFPAHLSQIWKTPTVRLQVWTFSASHVPSWTFSGRRLLANVCQIGRFVHFCKIGRYCELLFWVRLKWDWRSAQVSVPTWIINLYFTLKLLQKVNINGEQKSKKTEKYFSVR